MFFSCLVPHAFCLFSFDQPIRPRQHIRWDRYADLLRRLEVDNELELGRLLHWQVCWLGAFENFVDRYGSAPERVGQVRAVAQ
jgi:hypothetical protein